jgi:hypothetical protein
MRPGFAPANPQFGAKNDPFVGNPQRLFGHIETVATRRKQTNLQEMTK